MKALTDTEVCNVVDAFEECVEVNVQESNLAAEECPADEEPDVTFRISRKLWDRLFDHQKVAVRFLHVLHSYHFGGLIADEMGLGKTVQTIAFLLSLYCTGSLRQPEDTPPIDMSERDFSEWTEEQRTVLDEIKASRLVSLFNLKLVLILVPTTILDQWEQEFRNYAPVLKVIRLSGSHMSRYKFKSAITHLKTHGGICLSSYETVRLQLKFFLNFTWFYCILDEGQRIRNPDAQTTLAVKRLKIENRILLTGSPIQNDLREFWSIVDFISPGKFGTLPVFMEHFGEPIMKAGISHTSLDASRHAQQCLMLLKSYLTPHLLRRTKASLTKAGQDFDLPSKQEQIVLCPLTMAQYQIYVDFLITHNVDKEVSRSMTRSRGSRPRFRGKGARGEGNDIQAKALFYISVLAKVCNHPDLLLLSTEAPLPEDFGNVKRSGKLIVLSKILRTWIKGENRKVLVFSKYIKTLELIQSMIQDKYQYSILTGEVPATARLSIVEDFNNNPALNLMLLTTKVGSLGLNLTGASGVIIYDPDWNPTVDEQAQERAWRIGQRNDVTVFRLLCKGTIEEKIYKRQIFKQILSSKVLTERSNNKVFKASDFTDLFAFPPLPPGISEADILKEDAQLPPRLKAVFTKAISRLRTTDQIGSLTPMTPTPRRELSPTATSESKSPATAPVRTDDDTESDEDGVTKADEQGPASDVSSDCEPGEASDSLFKFLFSSKHVAGVLDHKASMAQSREITLSFDKKTHSSLKAMEVSRKNRLAFASDIPTWTGKHGLAGKPVWDSNDGTNSSPVWNFDELQKRFRHEPEVWDAERWTKQKLKPGATRVIEDVFGLFFRNKSKDWKVSTGDILMSFGPLIKTEAQKALLKAALNKTCTTTKEEGGPTMWQLKPIAQEILLGKSPLVSRLASLTGATKPRETPPGGEVTDDDDDEGGWIS
eukprot:Blabericola_migrator_1__10647@NODE_606_length_7355_cov_27_739572_g439_i0_p1_GENE_NODE_606_length_7355_cov_27_739572_g439_i0NODE_606_length_7355_cov_27_739572_g439_i0_p1_ORF_typecomplete_len937_score173_34SNF2_N/PF00176_23/2_4e64Helicase_C/PF00271_31/9_2e18ERCC3_RAD25_C/PF16203_5/8_3e11ResIII/PF04851_15/1_4e07HDA23/PF11496_8/9_6e05TFIIF_beta/PF02270_15/4e03TFIIF_beta/PF02270_15/0_59_NODE_606_length_7355_cov_27_739572_g439_i035986408